MHACRVLATHSEAGIKARLGWLLAAGTRVSGRTSCGARGYLLTRADDGCVEPSLCGVVMRGTQHK